MRERLLELPHKDSDSIGRLLVHYYYPANLMFKQKNQLTLEFDRKGKLSFTKQLNEALYSRLWLALLYVVCEELCRNVEKELKNRPEEFLNLIPQLRQITTAFAEHEHSLRVFRNGQLHFQQTPDKLLQFFESLPERLDWARSLHNSIGQFFSEYQALCEFTYLTTGRSDEANLRTKR